MINENPTLETVGERIRHFRRKMRMDQKDLAKLIGVSQGTITRYETGTIQTTIEILKRIAAALKVTVADLLPNESAPASDPWIEDPEIAWYGSCLKVGERNALTEVDKAKVRELHRTMIKLADQIIKNDR